MTLFHPDLSTSPRLTLPTNQKYSTKPKFWAALEPPKGTVDFSINHSPKDRKVPSDAKTIPVYKRNEFSEPKMDSCRQVKTIDEDAAKRNWRKDMKNTE